MASQAQSHPTFEDARELLGWRPRLGVLSVYLRIDPADRGNAWRTELRNGLAAAQQGPDGAGHEMRLALRSTADRVVERFGDQDMRSLPRGEAAFVEIAREPAEERWWSTHVPPRSAASVFRAGRPVLAPFLPLAARSRPRGIALVSAERVRLLERRPGHLEELESWELSLTSGGWRERKAPRSRDPARAQGVSAAGHDQFDERLEENRHRFLGECGHLAAALAAERDWGELLAFSSPQLVEAFRGAFHSDSRELVLGGEVDLIAEPVGRLTRLVEEAVARRDSEREQELVERTLEQARAGGHAVAGREEAMAALDEGRVGHLLLDEEAEVEPLIEPALATAARITPVRGEAAELLASSGGVAALLRY